MTFSPDLLRLKLAESMQVTPTASTLRDVRLPNVPGKAWAVVGVRRGGKTTFLLQQMAQEMALGKDRATQVYLSLEDERLPGLTAHEVSWMLDEHARLYPSARNSEEISLYVDEVQLVAGWETWVRRLIDTGGLRIFLSGSSAKLLSREVATSLRGRALEVLVHPFSFREALRHVGEEPTAPWALLPPKKRIALDAHLASYLAVGGFPEVQNTTVADRFAVLKNYADVMVLRDVIERHGLSNPHAVRWLQRYFLSIPGGLFSINKLYDRLRSQGVAISKDTLYALLDHFEDAFLVRTVSLHSYSERQKMVNPRKAYPIDTGLIPLYERTGRTHTGRSLETAVALHLERTGHDIAYVRTPEGWEVDFLADRPGERRLLVQVCLDIQTAETYEREVRALLAAHTQIPDAKPLLITLDSTPPLHALPTPIEWRPAAAWFLET